MTRVLRAHDFASDPLAGLSIREKQVAELAAGTPVLRDREVAAILNIATNTVQVHSRSIKIKLGIRSRGDLVRIVDRYRMYRDGMEGDPYGR